MYVCMYVCMYMYTDTYICNKWTKVLEYPLKVS